MAYIVKEGTPKIFTAMLSHGSDPLHQTVRDVLLVKRPIERTCYGEFDGEYKDSVDGPLCRVENAYMDSLCEGKALVEITRYGVYQPDGSVKFYDEENAPADAIPYFAAEMVHYKDLTEHEIAEFLVKHYDEFVDCKIQYHIGSKLRGTMFSIIDPDQNEKVYAKCLHNIIQVEDILDCPDDYEKLCCCDVNTFVAEQFGINDIYKALFYVNQFQFSNEKHDIAVASGKEFDWAVGSSLVDVHSVAGVKYAMIYPEYMGLAAATVCEDLKRQDMYTDEQFQQAMKDMLSAISDMNSEANHLIAKKVEKGKISINALRA